LENHPHRSSCQDSQRKKQNYGINTSIHSVNETAVEFLENDFNHQGVDHAPVKANLELIKPLIEQGDMEMLSQDISNGRELGNSRT